MKKKGFTLIELLAVIVILAIIALIATPIILGVINDAKNKSRENSINGFVEAIKLEAMKFALTNGGSNPNFTEDYLNTISYQGDKVTCGLDGETPGIYYSKQYGVVLHGCKVGNDDTLYYYGNGLHKDKNNLTYKEVFDSIKSQETVLTGNALVNYAKNLVYQNETCKTDGSTYQYMGGCYIKGASTNNYVWYSGFLWRIMGINSDGTVRLINEENVTAISYNANENSKFDGSHADKWLNEYFLLHLKGINVISTGTFCQGVESIETALGRDDCSGGKILTRKAGLISVDEYNLAGGAASYLKNGQNFWTNSAYNSQSAWYVGVAGNTNNLVVNGAYSLRAIINIHPQTIVTGGDGTLNNNWSKQNSPYILNENKEGNSTGTLGEKASSGEFVKFGDQQYRIVSHENGLLKLIMDGYYQEVTGTNSKSTYGENATFTINSGVGQKLNTDILNRLAPTDELKNKIIPMTWYQNNHGWGNSYLVSLEEGNPTRKIEKVKVGMIRLGEMLSGQSYTVLTKNGTAASSQTNATSYWLLTPFTDETSIWNVYFSGGAGTYDASISNGLRPVIHISSNSNILSGNGTPTSPYQL